MFKYTVKNILLIIPVLLCILFIIFTINQLTLGDPVLNFVPVDYTQEQYDTYAAKLGVDKPFMTQFFNYVKGIVTRFDFGTSYQSKRPVTAEIGERFPVSLKLGMLSCLLTVVVGIPLGVILATKQYSFFDYAITFLPVFLRRCPDSGCP